MDEKPRNLPSHNGLAFAVGIIAIIGIVATVLVRPPAWRGIPLSQAILFWLALLVAAFAIPKVAEWFYDPD